MKQYILIPAVTGSEWESVDFALITLDERRGLPYYKKMADLAKQMYKEHGVSELIVYSDEADFYTDMEQLPEECYKEFSEVQAQIIEFSDKFDTTLFSRPEQTIKYGQIKFGQEGVTFTGTGKHTDEEFWGDIPYSVLFGEVLNVA